MKKLLLFILLVGGCLAGQAQELYMMGLLEDDGQYDLLPCKADLQTKDYSQLPSKHSLKAYCPKVMSQGQYGTCVGWSTAYAARSIAEAVKWGWTDQTKINNESFSPLFVYAQIKKSNDDNCSVGTQIYEALDLMKEVGSVKLSAFNTLCANDVSESLKRQAAQYKIDDYFTLFNNKSSRKISKTEKVKKAISENNPVIIAMKVPVSFHHAGRVWSGEGYGSGNHAMCVVGYDDNESGGAFQIMNSWGTHWADNGFTWIRYRDFEEYVYHAYELYVKKIEVMNQIVQKNQQNSQTKIVGYINNKPAQSNRPEIIPSGGLSLQLYSSGSPLMWVYNKDQEAYTLPYSLETGNRYQINLTINGPAYVYVVGEDSRSNHSKIFPESDNTSAALTHQTNHLFIPSEDSDISLSAYKHVCVLYSKRPLDFDSLIRRINSSNGSFRQKVKSATEKDVTPVFIDL